MRNRRRDNIFSYFPDDIGFVENHNDPLYILLDGGAEYIRSLEGGIDSLLDNMFLDYMDPNMPFRVYYEDVEFFNDDGDYVEFELSGTSQIVDNESEFLSRRITGLGKSAIIGDPVTPDEEIEAPADLFPSGVIGLSYGFDWTAPRWYLSDGADFIHTCQPEIDDPLTLEVESSLNVATKVQSYVATGSDEYLNFETIPMELIREWDMDSDYEITIDGHVVKSGITLTYELDAFTYELEDSDYDVSPNIDGTSDVIVYAIGNHRTSDLKISYSYRIADVAQTPVSDVVVIDILDIDEFGNGIELTQTIEDELGFHLGDYIVKDNQILLNNGNTYRSRYIIEYVYRSDDKAEYLTQPNKRHFLGLKSEPIYDIG